MLNGNALNNLMGIDIDAAGNIVVATSEGVIHKNVDKIK